MELHTSRGLVKKFEAQLERQRLELENKVGTAMNEWKKSQETLVSTRQHYAELQARSMAACQCGAFASNYAVGPAASASVAEERSGAEGTMRSHTAPSIEPAWQDSPNRAFYPCSPGASLVGVLKAGTAKEFRSGVNPSERLGPARGDTETAPEETLDLDTARNAREQLASSSYQQMGWMLT